MDEGRYTTHEPIRINGYADFTSVNGVVGGNGTKYDPYIISGWDIDAHGAGNEIYIGNTTKYFGWKIASCTMHRIILRHILMGLVFHSTIWKMELLKTIPLVTINMAFI